MQLQKINVKNFRSLESETFIIKEIDGSKTFALIGVNESGKSSFLTAISFVDAGAPIFPQDFSNETENVEINLVYKLDPSEQKELRQFLSEKGFDKDLLSQIEVDMVESFTYFEPIPNTPRSTYDIISFKKNIFPGYTLKEGKPVKKEAPEEADFNLDDYFESQLPDHFWSLAHQTTFWKSDPKYLINEAINLENFAADPNKTSLPLKNCFNLAGITDIKAEIEKIKTSQAETSDLQDKLGDKVTSHIKRVWPNHPIKIKFQINNMALSFLIEDEGVKYKSKVVTQRSDGFKQFISFLLTISAQSSNKALSNALLLLDEPETHLHPQAQEFLKDELIKITKNKENNIVIFATHSNYMIDKEHMDRSFRVQKGRNGKTVIEKIAGQNSSYSEVNYEVFNIPTNDYHNELYGYLEDVNKKALESLPKTKKWKNKKTSATEDVSLPTYIRHSIHHPENTSNGKVTVEELNQSIEVLRKLK